MSAVTITVLDAAGTPQQFTAEPDAERWLYIPRGTKPAEPWFGECESQLGPNHVTASWGISRPLNVWIMPSVNDDFRIRPTGGRDWSAIAPHPDYSEWTEVTDETKPEDFSHEKYECQYNAINNKREPAGWLGGDSFAASHFLNPCFHWRIRRRKPQPEPQPEVPMCEKCVPELLGESDGDFAVRMLRGCTASVVIRPDYCGSVGEDKTLTLADALRLAAMIGGGK